MEWGGYDGGDEIGTGGFLLVTTCGGPELQALYLIYAWPVLHICGWGNFVRNQDAGVGLYGAGGGYKTGANLTGFCPTKLPL